MLGYPQGAVSRAEWISEKLEVDKRGPHGIYLPESFFWGTMSLPMAVNIARTGLNVMVYNRTGGKAGPALEAGAAES